MLNMSEIRCFYLDVLLGWWSIRRCARFGTVVNQNRFAFRVTNIGIRLVWFGCFCSYFWLPPVSYQLATCYYQFWSSLCVQGVTAVCKMLVFLRTLAAVWLYSCMSVWLVSCSWWEATADSSDAVINKGLVYLCSSCHVSRSNTSFPYTLSYSPKIESIPIIDTHPDRYPDRYPNLPASRIYTELSAWTAVAPHPPLIMFRSSHSRFSFQSL